jgi:hypothetical protein
MSAQLKTSIKYPGSLIRPRFEPGALLLDEDLTAIVDHSRGLSRLLFRSLFGCGVICGFRVTAQVECGNLTVAVAPGVALDCKGDPIEMNEQQTLGMLCAEKLPPDPLWVLIRRSARDHTCATRDVACPSDDGGAYKPTRAKDCFELTLTKDFALTHGCGCPPRPDVTGTPPAMAGTSGAPPAGPIPAPPAKDGPVGAAPATAGGAVPAPAADVIDKAPAAPPPPADWECHIPHYCGVCSCGCCDSCGDGWVVLARVSTKPKATPGATAQTNIRDVDYTVRRFIRPVLASDPLRSPERDMLCNRLLAAKADGS